MVTINEITQPGLNQLWFKIIFQKVDEHTVGERLIHSTKHHKATMH